MAAPPSISVVIPTRDRPELLRDALRSVAAQRLAPLEVRIADDGEHPLPREFATPGPPEHVVVRVGEGLLAAARNRGSEGARGDVLAFLDDDDRWQPDHMAGLAAVFSDPAVEFAWRDCAVIREAVDERGLRRDVERLEIVRGWDDAMMRDNDYLPPSGWGVRRSLFERLGGFDESFAFSEDWDFALRAAAVTRPRRVPGITVEVRMRASGHASADFGPERIDCLRRLEARHGLPPLEPRTFWEVAQQAARAPR